MSLVPYESLNLYISDATYTFEPMYADSSILRESLVIDRDTSALSMNVPPSATLTQEEVVTTFGIIGFIGLNGGEHVIVICGREKVGALNGSDVYRLVDVDILPLRKHPWPRTPTQIQDDETYLNMLNDLLKSGHFYFSYGYDLTRNSQSQIQLSSTLANRPLWQRADERFFWNLRIQQKMINIHGTASDPSRFILPVICGFIQISPVTIHGRALVYSLVSRRSKYRMGVRYHSRGIDDAGHVSNFVETEQVVELPDSGERRSYVQIRGSIPLHWRQVTNVMYKPALVIDNKPTTEKAFLTHVNDLISRYSRVIMVNMIDKHGYEEGLGREFFRLYSLANKAQLRYTHFDFHKECKKMRWDRISLLLDELDNELHAQGYCAIDPSGNLVQTQESVIRTNCIDCLDRTNVVQSVFAKQFLTTQLRELKILSSKEFIDEIPSFISLFRNVWANNADAISLQYSGTGALKTDYTRTGKRSFEGVLQDFSNSVVRYVKNNFFDGLRQDAYDLLLGNFEVIPGHPSPFSTQTAPEFILGVGGLILSGLLFLYAIIVPKGYLRFFGFLLLAIALLTGTIVFVIENGRAFVSIPHLISVDMSIPAKHVPKTRKPSASTSSKWSIGNENSGIQMTEIDKSL